MSDIGQKKPLGSQSSNSSANPFAKALAEMEKSSAGNLPTSSSPFNLPLNEALANQDNQYNQDSQDYREFSDNHWEEEQKKKLEEQRRREALRKKLHDKVNPVDTIAVYNSREERVKKEIEELRKELRALSLEISAFHKEIDVTLMTETVSPGQEGKYYLNFFQQLRAFIILLRKKVSSARTWATTMQSKKKKKGSAVMSFDGKHGHEKTKTIFDMMHHEVSNARSGE